MEDITEDEIKIYGFKNPGKLAEIINRFSKILKEETGIPLNYGEFELSDRWKFELQLMEYENIIEDILKNHCT